MGKVADDRPCMWCGDTSDQATMVLCNCCNTCYHPQCAEESEGTRVQGGPWFCHACKGFLVLWGAPDVIQDWPLMDYLWTGALPQDPVQLAHQTGGNLPHIGRRAASPAAGGRAPAGVLGEHSAASVLSVAAGGYPQGLGLLRTR